jgi:hypothetical protein
MVKKLQISFQSCFITVYYWTYTFITSKGVAINAATTPAINDELDEIIYLNKII